MDWWYETGVEMCRRLPHDVVMQIMSDRRQSEIVLTQERRGVMEAVRRATGTPQYRQSWLLSDVNAAEPNHTSTLRVKVIDMGGYKYQLHNVRGSDEIKLYREDDGGLHYMQGEVLVQWLIYDEGGGLTQEYIFPLMEWRVMEFRKKCENCDGVDVDDQMCVLDDADLLFGD
jgi:hypothetical protein